MIIGNSFFIVKSKEMRLAVDDAEQFYTEHRGKARPQALCGEEFRQGTHHLRMHQKVSVKTFDKHMDRASTLKDMVTDMLF